MNLINTFIVFDVIGTASHPNISVYCHGTPHEEAININKILRIFPASIRESKNCTGIMLDNNMIFYIDEPFTEVLRRLANVSSNEFDY